MGRQEGARQPAGRRPRTLSDVEFAASARANRRTHSWAANANRNRNRNTNANGRHLLLFPSGLCLGGARAHALKSIAGGLPSLDLAQPAPQQAANSCHSRNTTTCRPQRQLAAASRPTHSACQPKQPPDTRAQYFLERKYSLQEARQEIS